MLLIWFNDILHSLNLIKTWVQMQSPCWSIVAGILQYVLSLLVVILM